ncbi:MAG: XRE family transcriptional regulator [Cetobacterium sp.]|uniref:XRE family transcriptional regulator n=1 Tax=Cetobacterium sp. TaxID=2071632 RepID=UPI003EE4F110
MNVGEKIKEIRDEYGYSMDQVIMKLKAEGVDINKSTLSRIENGERQKIDATFLVAMCNIFKYNFFSILGLQNTLVEGNVTGDVENTITLPVYGKASAGNGFLNMDYIVRTETILRFNDEAIPKNSFIVEVNGESMYPTLLDGDLAIVNPNYREVNLNNKICVVKYEDEIFIKRLSLNEEFLILKSDNPDRVKYSDIIIPKKRCEDFFCFGFVIERRTKF